MSLYFSLVCHSQSVTDRSRSFAVILEVWQIFAQTMSFHFVAHSPCIHVHAKHQPSGVTRRRSQPISLILAANVLTASEFVIWKAIAKNGLLKGNSVTFYTKQSSSCDKYSLHGGPFLIRSICRMSHFLKV